MAGSPGRHQTMWQQAAKRVATQNQSDSLGGVTQRVMEAPNPALPNRQPLFSDAIKPEDVKAWMLSKHSTLWGRSVTLHKEGVQEAIDFFISLIKDFEEFRRDGHN